MAKNTKTLKVIQRLATKTYHVLKLLFRKIGAGILYIWNRPLIVSAILLILVIFLFNLLITQTFKPYLNCAYLLGNKLAMPAFFCEGKDLVVFKIPGLKDVMDPPLEFVRKIISWSIVVFFAFLSLYLTIIIINLKTVVKLLTFNKEEWKNLMANLRIWLLIFGSFCLLFYFIVIR